MQSFYVLDVGFEPTIVSFTGEMLHQEAYLACLITLVDTYGARIWERSRDPQVNSLVLYH